MAARKSERGFESYLDIIVSFKVLLRIRITITIVIATTLVGLASKLLQDLFQTLCAR